MAFPVNPALEAAVAADADSDVPRLAYADWLDEHGDPVRAEFIRVQCRLAELTPADDGWAERKVREGELVGDLEERLDELRSPFTARGPCWPGSPTWSTSA